MESRDEPPTGVQPLPEGEWQPLQQQFGPGSPAAALAEARPARRVAIAVGIAAGVVGQFAIWWIVWAAVVAWAMSVAWSAGG